MYETVVYCLDVTLMSQFLSILDPGMWSIDAPNIIVHSLQAGDVTWAWDPVLEEYCHDQF